MFDQLHWLAALAPLAVPIVFYSLIGHAALLAGEWPSPKGMPMEEAQKVSALFGFHSVIAFLSIVALSLLPIAWLILLDQARSYPNLAAYGIRFAVFAGNLTFCLWLGLSDPGQFLRWFLNGF